MDPRELRLQEIRSLINHLFRPEGWKDESIFESLCLYFSNEDIDAVYELLTKKGDTQSYYWLVKYLVQVERPRGFEKLFSLFLQESDAIRRIARQGVVKIAPDERYALLVRMLQLKQNKEVCFAAEELGTLGKIQAIPELLNILEESDQEEIQISILRSLGRLQDARSLKTLEKYVKNGTPKIQEEAILSLYKFTSVPNVKFLKRCFQSDSHRVREISYFTAARSRNRRIESDLAEGLARESNTSLQFNILSSLRRIQTRTLFDIVFRMTLNHFSMEVHMIAQSALRRSHSKKVMKWLMEDEKKRSGKEKALILKLLADYTDQKEIFKIFEKNALKDQEARIRLLAIETLGNIKEKASCDLLMRLIRNDDEFSYAATLAFLNQVQPKDLPFIEEIFLATGKYYDLVHQLFLNFCIRLPKPFGLPHVIESQIQIWMTSSNIFLRSLACRAAFRLKSQSILEQLQKMVLIDSDKRVRCAALEALGNAIELNEVLFLQILINAQKNNRLMAVANHLAQKINLTSAQYASLLIKTIDVIVEQQKSKTFQSGLNKKQYVVILRNFVSHRLEHLLQILKTMPWSDAQAWVIMTLLNSLNVNTLELYDLEFLIEHYRNSQSIETKQEFLKFFQVLKIRTPSLEKMIFETLAEPQKSPLRDKVEEVVASWVVLAEKGN